MADGQEKRIYSLLLEEDISIGHPVLYLGYGHFFYNVDPPGERKDREFIIMYCKPASAEEDPFPQFIIGVSLVNKKKGEIMQWNPGGKTEDIANKIGFEQLKTGDVVYLGDTESRNNGNK